MFRADFVGVGTKAFMTIMKVALFAIVTTFGGTTLAQAQSVDWLVNIDDTTFDPIPAGGTIEYMIDVDTNGAQAAPATTITVDIPATTELRGISGDFTNCSVGGIPLTAPINVSGPAAVVCDVPALTATGAASQASSVFDVLTLDDVVISVTATVPTSAGTATDPDDNNNDLTEQTTVQAGADLDVSLTVPGNVVSGGLIDFDFTVLNNGPNTANSFTIQFPIPTGVFNITGPAGGPLPTGCSSDGTTVTCLVTGPVTATNSVVRSLRGQVSASASSVITSTVSVLNGDPSDPITTNNEETVNTTVSDGIDASISLTQSGGGNLLVNDPSQFVISTAYSGSVPSGTLTMETTIPLDYTIDSVIPPAGWTCAPPTAAQFISCTRLPDGADVPGPNQDLGDIIINTTANSANATSVTAEIIVSGQTDQNLSNNTDTVTANIEDAVVDLRANKRGPNPALVVVGASYNFQITATNIGNAPFIGTVRMVDNLPEGMSVTAITPRGWTCSDSVPVSTPISLPVVGPAMITCEQTYTSAAPLEAGVTTENVVLRTLITSASTTTRTNSNTVSTISTGPDSILDVRSVNDTTSVTVTAQGAGDEADVSLIKTADRASVAAGDAITYTLEIANSGPQSAANVRVFDRFEDLVNNTAGATNAGLVSVALNPGNATNSTCPATPVVGNELRLDCVIALLPVCNSSLDPGADTCPTIDITVRPGGEPGNRTNRASARSQGTLDPSSANNTGTVGYEVTAAADVAVTKNATPDPARAGQEITYVVTAANLATFEGTSIPSNLSTANNVVITDSLPDNVRFVSATPSTGSCTSSVTAGDVTSGDTVTCSVGNLASGVQATVTIVVSPTNITRGTTIVNNVSVASDTTDINLTNNDADASVLIEQPVLDILVNKDDSVDPVLLGGNTVYTLRVTNAGPSLSENVVVTDVLPASIFAYRSHTVSGSGTCGTVPIAQATPDPNPANRTLECSFPFLPVGASETIEVTMQSVASGSVENTVSISSDEIVAGFDTEADNNQTSETTTVGTTLPTGDIAVTSKVPSAATLNLREDFDFVVTVANNPDAPGTQMDGVVLSDTLPTGMVLTGAPAAIVGAGTTTLNSCTGTAGDTSFSCTFGDVSPAAEVEITVPVKMISITSLGQMITNTASVTSTTLDGNNTNNSSDGVVTVNASSLAGTLYRDFNNSATPTVSGQDLPGDTGISGVTITLTGTAVDGEMITETAVTNGSGDYNFPLLPAGTYTVTRGTVSEPGLTTGQNTVGSVGGTLPNQSSFTGVPLPAATAATDYDFAEVPSAAAPSIALIKRADTSALSNPPQAGQVVTYNFIIRNTGAVTLSNVTLTDTVPGVTLTGTAIPTLAPGAQNTTAYSATYTLLPGDIGSTISNTATVTGTPTTGGNVSDISGTSFTNDTPTNTPITVFTPRPAISLDKILDDTATQDGAAVGEELAYSFVITNTGNVPLFNVTLSDDLAGVVLSGSPIPQLNPGQSNTTAYTATYAVTAGDIAAGRVVNDATVVGNYPNTTTPAVSDDDSETALFETIEAIPEVFPPFDGDGGSTTSMLESDRLNGGPATLGNVRITVLREDPGVTLNPDTAIITLAPGNPAGVYEVDYRICSIATPTLCDETTETVVQRAVPSIETTKMQTVTDDGDGTDGVGDTIVYEITIVNDGNIALENVTPADTMRDLEGGSLVLTTGPDFVSSSAGSIAGRLEIGETATYSATFAITEQAVNAGGVENTVLVRGVPTSIPGVPGIPPEVTDVSDDGDDFDGNTSDDPTILNLIPSASDDPSISDVELTKSTTSDVVRRGEAVPYTITVRNNDTTSVGPFTLMDTLPSGFIFVPGSASLTPTQTLAGKITWEGLNVPAQSAIEITLSARVLTGARSGEHINRALLTDPVTGASIVPEATAAVRILPEAVFDCGDVIGKVFVDLNGDGYQNGPPRENGITDQTLGGGKGGKLPPPAPKTEQGIPNVRLVTVDGSIITTDQHGRYSVPCAMLPEDRGSNFILKLDTRSLPSGYRVTTENPRVMRLTPGMMTEMNFGATIGKVVRVDLDASAFGVTQDGKVALSAPLKAGIAQLLPQIANDSVNLRLTFHVAGGADANDVKSARQMLRAVDRHIKAEWRKVGRTRLRVEQSIARAGE